MDSVKVDDLPPAVQNAHHQLFQSLRVKKVPLLPGSLISKAKKDGCFLGEGTYGSCYMAKSSNGVALCVKIMKAKTIEQGWNLLSKEVEQMICVKHVRGVVPLVGVCLLPKPAIITKYSGKPLYFLLKKAEVNPKNTMAIIAQFVQIIRRMTEAGLCHCDLKADNIVVQFVGKFKTPRVTVIDVGLMRKFGQKLYLNVKKRQAIYAPELYEGECVSPASQVYQVGRVIAAVLGQDNNTYLSLREIAKACMSYNTKNRPRIEQVFQVCKTNYYEKSEEQVQPRQQRIPTSENEGAEIDTWDDTEENIIYTKTNNVNKRMREELVNFEIKRSKRKRVS